MANDLIEFRVHHWSPPEIVTMDVPSSASLSSRFFITSSGTGFEADVVFVAVAAGEIAAPHRDDVSQNDVIRRKQGSRDHRSFAEL
jgi:hypothetical protein